MKHKAEGTRADCIGQVQITFTHKQLTAWGGACAVAGKFLERIRFREWVLAHVPVEEHSPNAKGIYEKGVGGVGRGGVGVPRSWGRSWGQPLIINI